MPLAPASRGTRAAASFDDAPEAAVSLAMIGASCVVSLLTVELASDKLFNAFGPLYRFVRDWRASASKAQAP